MIDKLNKKTVLIGIGIALILCIGAFAGYKYFNKSEEPPANPTYPINYGPPTAEEEAESQARQAEREAQEQASSSSSDGVKKKVTPVITNASQNGQEIMVTAYISGVFEDGGNCSMTAKKGTLTVNKTNKGFADASTTNCPPFIINRSEFSSPGDWQVTVSYESSSASGASQSKTLTLQ